MNRKRSGAALGDIEEFFHDMIVRSASVDEEQIVVLKTGIDETFGVVDFLVETNDAFDVVFAEIAYVGFGRVQWIAVLYFAFGVRA